MSETTIVLSRALNIAADIFQRAGMCIQDNRCEKVEPGSCEACIRHFLIKKAKAELRGDSQK